MFDAIIIVMTVIVVVGGLGFSAYTIYDTHKKYGKK